MTGLSGGLAQQTMTLHREPKASVSLVLPATRLVKTQEILERGRATAPISNWRARDARLQARLPIRW
jgi:hypothetical protein